MRLPRGTRAWIRKGGKSSRDGRVQGFRNSGLKMGISACIVISTHDGIAQSRGGSMVEGTGWQRHGAGDAASQRRASRERPVVPGAQPGGQQASG